MLMMVRHFHAGAAATGESKYLLVRIGLVLQTAVGLVRFTFYFTGTRGGQQRGLPDVGSVDIRRGFVEVVIVLMILRGLLLRMLLLSRLVRQRSGGFRI